MAKHNIQETSFDSFSPLSASQDVLCDVRILFMIDEVAPIAAGSTERLLLQMIDICKYSRMRPQVCVFRNTGWLTDKITGCPVIHLQLNRVASLRGVRSLIKLKKWIREQKFDILQAMSPRANSIGRVAGRVAGVPIILSTDRDLDDKHHGGPGNRVLRSHSKARLLLSEPLSGRFRFRGPRLLRKRLFKLVA
ncbi:MAG TPA: glycosyltransferase [Acidobacteriaceae bacterium]|nr:glycosyltransferase [Acidobacteriaceae bacterium]